MSIKETIRRWLLDRLDGISRDKHMDMLVRTSTEQFELGQLAGVAVGETRAKIIFAVLPLPFTEAQLEGRHYGEFITPVGFGIDEFGECNIPAPGIHGYEQRALYASKDELRNGVGDLMCHRASKFDKPADSDALVPVIVTVLR